MCAHLWKAPGAPTAGCTAMADATMARLYGWLRPEAKPVFVLLPQAAYDRLQRLWHLPQVGRAGARGSPLAAFPAGRRFRSEERRVGKEGVRTGSSRWSPDH